MTKAVRTWIEAYEPARAIMPQEKALERADAVLLHRMGVGLSFHEEPGALRVVATLPDGRQMSHSCVGYMTQSIRVRLTKAILDLLTPAALKRAPLDVSE